MVYFPGLRCLLSETVTTVVGSVSRLKTVGELKIALTGTSRRAMRERCANTPGLTHQRPSSLIIKSRIIESHKGE